MRELLGIVLRREGYEVVAAEDGKREFLMGITPALVGFTDQMVKGFADARGLSAADPHKAYAYASLNGVDTGQLAGQIGSNANDAQKWMQQAGLGGQAQAPAQPPNPGSQMPTVPQPPRNPYLPNPGANPLQPNAGRTSHGTQPNGPGNQNPYIQQVGQDITRQVNNNLQRNILPGIGRGAVAAGGYGGSRQGIAEGLAAGEASAGLGGALANLYSNQFNTDRNYGLSSDALDLSVYNANQNWMNQGQQNQLNTIDKMLGWNQMGVNNATTIQNTPLNYYSQFANMGQGLGGLGNTQTQNMQGNPYLGAIGGYQLGSKIWGP